FDLSLFRHRAFFKADGSRVEMHIEAVERQIVRVAGEAIRFDAGETIWTESSYKYDYDALRVLVGAVGFQITRLWTDSDEKFWVAYLSAEPAQRSEQRGHK